MAQYCWHGLLPFFLLPGVWKQIRQSKFLTMLHPVYFGNITAKLGVGNSGIDSTYIKYLKNKLCILDGHERMYNLLLGEVYVKPELYYEGVVI